MTSPNDSKGKLELLQSNENDETCQTFVLNNEDHTLGNSLRYIVQKNPEVEFCGYAVPHPSEQKINLRIQTRSESATAALQKGLTDLHNLCGHVLKTFETAVSDYKQRMEVTE